MPVKTDQYIFPPRAADAIPRESTDFLGKMGWTAQYKYNDSRCIVKYCANGTVELWNRHAERFRDYHAPDHLVEQLETLRDILGLDTDTVSMLDGGVLDKKHSAIKDTIVIWDILVRNGTHLLGTTYKTRYDTLLDTFTEPLQPWWFQDEAFGYKFTPDIFLPACFHPNSWDDAWNVVAKVNTPFTTGSPGDTNYEIKPVLEGLVFKNPKGILEMGYREKNNDSWMMRSRVHTGRHRF